MDMPTVLILGRPNVGKSTLFNRLVGRAAAVVFDRPGVTRDLLEAEMSLENGKIRIVDSAGWPYPGEDPELSARINRKVEQAVKTCDLIFWIVDGPAGRTGGEDAFAQRLHPYRKKTILIINKLDELQRPDVKWAESEFAGLPWDECCPITAKHGRGIVDLLELVEKRLLTGKEDSVSDTENSDLRISILGRPNVGKSTLVNKLLMEDRVVVSDKPGTTRDAVETSFRHNDKKFVLVDTAGVRRVDRITDGLERTISRIALQTGANADVTLVMMDIAQGLSEQDLKLLSYLWRRGVTAIAVANKWDLVPDRTGDSAQDLEAEFRRRSHETEEAPFILISAKTGHKISRLMDMVLESHAAAHQKISTPNLNRRLHEWNPQMPSGLFRGNPGKLKYGVQTGQAPLTFKIFVNDPKTFRREAHRYIRKRFREAFGLHGVPILLELVTDK